MQPCLSQCLPTQSMLAPCACTPAHAAPFWACDTSSCSTAGSGTVTERSTLIEPQQQHCVAASRGLTDFTKQGEGRRPGCAARPSCFQSLARRPAYAAASARPAAAALLDRRRLAVPSLLLHPLEEVALALGSRPCSQRFGYKGRGMKCRACVFCVLCVLRHVALRRGMLRGRAPRRGRAAQQGQCRPAHIKRCACLADHERQKL